MTEMCLKRLQLCNILITDLSLLCSFIISHPLYFSYLIFFSPYLLKLISFLSPLFITTSILLLAILTISPSFITHNNLIPTPENKLSESCEVSSVLLSAYNALVEKLNSLCYGETDEFQCLEDFEAYKIVFERIPVEILDYKSAEVSEIEIEIEVEALESGTAIVDDDQDLTEEFQESSCEIDNTEKKLEDFFKELDEFEHKNLSHNVEEKKIEIQGTKIEKVVEKQKEEESHGSEAVDKAIKPNLDYTVSNQNLGSYGSMRKEKEWKRTLACKLYEERHTTSDINSEGMDMLWETHELDAMKSKIKRDNNAKKKKKMVKKKSDLKCYEDDDEEDDEEDMNGQLCCLQALNFSAGKMNLGLGRPNLVKFSKTIRGFGWLHHVSKKNNKKVHCGDSF